MNARDQLIEAARAYVFVKAWVDGFDDPDVDAYLMLDAAWNDLDRAVTRLNTTDVAR